MHMWMKNHFGAPLVPVVEVLVRIGGRATLIDERFHCISRSRER